MNKTMLALLIFCILFLNPSHADISLSGSNNQILIYDSDISFEANEIAFRLYENASTKPILFQVTSLGGGINAGLQLGEWIVKNKLDVSVPEYCVSSCANYVFTAGKTKMLGKHAYLIWHGGAHQPGLAESLKTNANRRVEQTVAAANQASARAEKFQEIDAHIAFIRQRENAFFQQIGVNPNITILGQIFPYRSTYQGHGYSGWDYSMLDLAKLGVNNILIEDNHWMPNSAAEGIRVHRLILE